MNCFSVNISRSSECGTCLNCLLKLREGPSEHLCVFVSVRFHLSTWLRGGRWWHGGMDRRATHTHTHTHRRTHMVNRNSSHSHVTKSLWGRGNKEKPSGCVHVLVCVCLMVLSTKPTKILPAIKKCSALAPQLIFPPFLQLQTSGAIVISSPSVSIWMPESQLRLRLIESAPGPSHAGTQMSSAWGGEEWRDGGRGAQGLNKRS